MEFPPPDTQIINPDTRMSYSNECILLEEEPKKAVLEISVHEFTTIPLIERPLLIDVRGESEWRRGHADTAVHLDIGHIDTGIRGVAPDPNTPIICYCNSGIRSALVAQWLQECGYTHVASLAGGFIAWQLAGEPVSHPE